MNTVQPGFNKVPRDWGNWFVISRFFSIHYTITGLKNIVGNITRNSFYKGSLNGSSTVSSCDEDPRSQLDHLWRINNFLPFPPGSMTLHTKWLNWLIFLPLFLIFVPMIDLFLEISWRVSAMIYSRKLKIRSFGFEQYRNVSSQLTPRG